MCTSRNMRLSQCHLRAHVFAPISADSARQAITHTHAARFATKGGRSRHRNMLGTSDDLVHVEVALQDSFLERIRTFRLSGLNVAWWFHDRNALRPLMCWAAILHAGCCGNGPSLCPATHVFRNIESRTCLHKAR